MIITYYTEKFACINYVEKIHVYFIYQGNISDAETFQVYTCPFIFQEEEIMQENNLVE